MRTARIWGRPKRQAVAMLQLLDLARANAALRCEVTQLRQETESLRRLLSDVRGLCTGSSGCNSTASERKDTGPALAVNCQEIVHPGHLCDVGGCRPTIPAERETRMNIHKNARTTPRSRGQIVQRVLTHQEAPGAVATAIGVSERTVRKWVARYAAAAEAGLADRSCRPQRSPHATPPLLVSWVERLRRQRWSGAEIAQALHLSASTVARLLRRQGLARLRQLAPPVPGQRYQWTQPGSLAPLDIKKLARIGRVCHRITRAHPPAGRGIGLPDLHRAV